MLWPGKIQPGSETTVPSYFPDWFPTLTAIAKGQVPEDQQLDGIDLSDVLLGKTGPKRTEPMIWDFNGYGGIVAIRDGNWKAVRRNLNRPNRKSEWELYNLASDRNETSDLATQHPEVVKRLESAYLNTRTVEPDFPTPIYDKLQKTH